MNNRASATDRQTKAEVRSGGRSFSMTTWISLATNGY